MDEEIRTTLEFTQKIANEITRPTVLLSDSIIWYIDTNLLDISLSFAVFENELQSHRLSRELSPPLEYFPK